MGTPSHQLVDHFFRHESANLVAVLTRAFGIRRLELVEDMVQAAMLEAVHAWKQQGPPENPAAWIHRVAKNRILDALRRESIHQQAITHSGQTLREQESLVDQWLEEERIPDSLLRMMFVCCHPLLDRKTQIALTLKTLCGFGTNEIARGLFLSRETVKKRIQRGKRDLANRNIPLELPEDNEVTARLDVIHDVLYLMFNEGYSTSQGTEPVRDDICEEATRLCHLLCVSPYALPATKALLALLLFHAARLDARIDSAGHAVLLEEQDRSKWNQDLIMHGKMWLARSKDEEPTTFHLEAAIAMQHCEATSVEATNWRLIVRFYDRLIQLRDSPIYALNRAIALGQAGEIDEALRALNALRENDAVGSYFLLDCALAQLHELAGDKSEAVNCYLDAMRRGIAPHEQALLERKLRRISP